MDILIGGIPRSGTTALARAVGLHPEIFCWFSESGILPRFEELLRGLPLLPANLPKIEHKILDFLRSNLIDMAAAWKDKLGTSEDVILQDVDIIELSKSLTAILSSYYSISDILSACSRQMREFFARTTDRLMIAEKTPSNVLLFDEFPGLAESWLMMQREPFAVIASMAVRAGEDIWAAHFSGEIERRIGLYIKHSRNIMSAMRQPELAKVFDYQRLMKDPTGVMVDVCMFLKIEPSRSFLYEVMDIVGDPTASNDHWQKFSPLDRWKVLNLCRPAMTAFGYDAQFYGVSFEHMTHSMPATLDLKIEPLYGVGAAETEKDVRWMESKSGFAVYAPVGVNTLTLDIYSEINRMVATMPDWNMERNEWRISAFGASAAERPLPLTEALIEADGRVEFEIDLRGAEPIGYYENWRLFKIEIETNFSYTPMYSVPDGEDARDLSILLLDYRLQ